VAGEECDRGEREVEKRCEKRVEAVAVGVRVRVGLIQLKALSDV